MKNRPILFYLLIVVFFTGSVLVAAPATLVQSVSDGGETITLRMTKESSRGPNFEVWVQNGTGAYDVHSPAEVSTYIGTVDEYPGAIAAGILKSDGDLWARVYFDRGYTWFTLDNAKTGELGGIYTPVFVKPTLPTVTEGHAGTTTYRWDLAIDVDNDYYTGNYIYYTGDYANDVAKCLENIEFSLMQLRAIYLRDTLLYPVLGRITIRASNAHDPYNGISSSGGLLNAVVTEWGSNHADADRDATALATPNIGGGIAYLGVIGNGYTVNQTWGDGDFDLVTRHETGHNWGVYDFHANSPEGYTIDCGNDLGRFAGPSVQSIFDQRDLKMGFLVNQGTYSIIDVPPYAALDLATITSENTTVTIDVLGNDHDTNGDAFVIDSFDSTSDLGGTITLSAGTGPSGRDELTYTSSIQPGLTDNFFYTIVDSSGSIATGVVVVYHDVPKSLIGYWRLDETTGTTAQDSSGNERTGTVNGTTFDSGSTVDSEFGNALVLDGIDDNVSVPATNLNSNTVTMTAWIKRDGNQGYFKGIFFSRSAYTCAGLNFLSTTNRLAHCWGVDAAIWNWNSGLTVPNDTWTFVALAVDPTGATLYMDSGSGLVSSRNNVAHPIQQFEDVTRIGGDSYNGYMKGKIDDARIYNYTLTQEQIEAVRDGGKAANPNPTDKITEAPINPTLSWAPNATATSHDVYFGTSQAAVEDANTLSPEYMGSRAETTYEPNELSTNSTYFWRIDEVNGGTVKGDVWQFTTGVYRLVESNLKAHYSFDTDDVSGSTALDRSPEPYYDGNIMSAPSVVNGKIGQALSFNGINDHVTISRVIRDSFTISMWVKTTQTGGVPHWYLGKGLVDAECPGVVFDFGTSLVGNKFGFGVFSPTITSTTVINDNAWHHCVATRSAMTGEIKVYVDGGSAENSITTVTTSLTTPTRITIGMLQTNNNFFNGRIDDVAIWDRVLSQEEIQNMYDHGLLGNSFVENNLPEFATDPFSKPDARESNSYSDSIADSATDSDPGDILTYTLESGLGWLEVLENGLLTGVPVNDDVGLNAFTVRVHDGHGGYDDATMNINVDNTYNGQLGLVDLANFAAFWLESDCPGTPGCDPADINDDGVVNDNDLKIMGVNWLQ